jgi:hypothetical protein
MEQLIGANEKQVAGDHYRAKAIQPWDYILANQLGYLEGNVVKYVSRWKEKGGVQDLHKARHYLEKLIEVTELQSKRPDHAEIIRRQETMFAGFIPPKGM